MSFPKRIILSVVIALLLLGCGDDPVEPPNDPDTIESEAQLIEALASAYRSQDLPLFESLFANDVGAVYSFTRVQGDSVEVLWDSDEETRIHARMFEPQGIAPPEPPLADALWIEAVQITLTRLEDFSERQDLYRSDSNPEGLDPERWRASEARYTTDVAIAARRTQFRVEGESARFLVIRDLAKNAGETQRFLILGWEEECSSLGGNECWSEVKRLYRSTESGHDAAPASPR
ncbi:MAG: hypothetical protein JSW67_13320 [Candidatus Latescibacterota bacterium]|nr:MAG: hypothetical protein JSW67_13320 [Candidatus Latescibacterota bacterium]